MALHYKKDGTLDMRYSSSKAAVAQSRSSRTTSSGYGGSVSQFSTSTGSFSGSSELHFKKDASLDMRYRSSKIAVGQAVKSPPGLDGLHYKKDGSLDMRYASSKTVVASGCVPGVTSASPTDRKSPVAYPKTDGSPYRNYKLTPARGKGAFDIPESVPRKKDGTPDMRTRIAKEWVKQQAGFYSGSRELPRWVPTKKDGTVDGTKAIGRAFIQVDPAVHSTGVSWRRQEYWNKRILDEAFLERLLDERKESQALPPPASIVYNVNVVTRMNLFKPGKQPTTQEEPTSQEELAPQEELVSQSASYRVNVPEKAREIGYSELQFAGEVLGKGTFGVVEKAAFKGVAVAVKKLHLTQLTRKEKADFEKEVCIFAAVGQHRNLIYLHGYCTSPPCIIMELVELGSLSQLLHYNDDPAIEAKMTDGRVKRNLVCGTAEGMLQLHVARVVHGDLKPQNVLVTKDFTAKVTDFGLSTLRGKTSSSIRSGHIKDDEDDDDGEVEFSGVVGGTSAYMAPELLESTSPPDFPVDVYSFGILLNEVVSEEEPYSDQYGNFAGRGPFGAANYARLGKRPTISKTMTTRPAENLITQCWSKNPGSRPDFERIVAAIRDPKFAIRHSVHPDPLDSNEGSQLVETGLNRFIVVVICIAFVIGLLASYV